MRILFRENKENDVGLSAIEVDSVIGFPGEDFDFPDWAKDHYRYSPIFWSFAANMVVIPIDVPSQEEGDRLVRTLYETGMLDLTNYEVAVAEEDPDYDEFDDYYDDDDDDDDDDGYVSSGPWPGSNPYRYQ